MLLFSCLKSAISYIHSFIFTITIRQNISTLLCKIHTEKKALDIYFSFICFSLLLLFLLLFVIAILADFFVCFIINIKLHTLVYKLKHEGKNTKTIDWFFTVYVAVIILQQESKENQRVENRVETGTELEMN